MTDVILSIMGVLILGDALSKLELLNWRRLHWGTTYIISTAAGFCMVLTPFFSYDPFTPETKYLLHAILLGFAQVARLLCLWVDIMLRQSVPAFAPDRRINRTNVAVPNKTSSTKATQK